MSQFGAGQQTSLTWTRWQRAALVVGVLGLVLTALGWLVDPASFFAAYLTAYLFWSGIALGCLGTALMQQVTGGLWGLTVRRIAEAGRSHDATCRRRCFCRSWLVCPCSIRGLARRWWLPARPSSRRRRT